MAVEREHDLSGVRLHMPARWRPGRIVLAAGLALSVPLLLVAGVMAASVELWGLALLPSAFLMLLVADLHARRPATVLLAVDHIRVQRPRLRGTPTTEEIPLDRLRRCRLVVPRASGGLAAPPPFLLLEHTDGGKEEIGAGHPREALAEVSAEINRAIALHAGTAAQGSARDVPRALQRLRAKSTPPSRRS